MAEGRAPHGRLRRWLLRPVAWSLALLALALGALAFAARSGWLRERARVLAETRLTEALGRAVRIERLELSLVPLEVEAWGVSVAGPQPGGPALAEIGHLSVVGELEGSTRPVLTLLEVRLERPVFRLHLLADGSDDLPRIGGRTSGSGGRLRVRLAGLEIRDGWFELGEERLPLSLSARGVESELVEAGGALLGEAQLQEVEVLLPKARPYRARVAAKVRLLADRIELRSAEVAGPDLAANLRGEIVWRGGTRVHLAGRVETSDLLARELGYFSEPLSGSVAADAKFLWESGRAWSVTGNFAVPVLDFWGLRAEEVAGRLSLGADQLGIEVERGRTLGGRIEGRLRFDLAAVDTPMQLDLDLAGASLERLLASREIVLGAPLDAALAGQVRLRIPLAGGGPAEGAIELAVAPEGRPGGLPLSGPATFDLGEGRLTIREVALSSDAVGLRATGAYELAGERGSFDYVATTDRLGTVARLLPVEIDPKAPELWMPTAGAGRLAGRLELAPAGVSTRLELDLLDVAAPGLVADRVGGELGVDRSGLSALRLTARRGAAGLAISGHLPFSETEPLALRVEARDWPVADGRPWLPFELPLDGPVTGAIDFTGSVAALSGTAKLAVAPALLGGFECRSVEATFEFDPDRLRVAQATLSVPAGSVTARGDFEIAPGRLDLVLSARGLDLAAPPFSDLVPVALAGSAGLDGTLRGTLDSPDLDLQLRASAVTVAGDPRPDSALRLRWANAQLSAEGSLLSLAEISGGGPADRQHAALVFHLVAPDLTTFARVAGVPAETAVSGRIAGDLRVDGSLFGDGPVRARLELPEVDIDLDGHQITALEPVRIGLSPERIEVDSLFLGERANGSELFVSGPLSLTGERQLDLRLQASLPASLIATVAPALTVSGQLEALAAIRGTLAHPRVSGQAELDGGRILLAGFPHTFEQVRASVLFYPDRLVVDSVTAELGGGRLRGGGTLAWQGTGSATGPATGPDYRFQLAAERVGLRYPAGWLLRGDADLTLQSQGEGRSLRGTVRLDRAYFLENLSVNVGQMIGRLLERQRLEAASTDELLAGTSLGISVVAPQALRVRNNLADLRGSADLSVRGTLAQPTLFGRVEAERGGKVIYSGTEYEVERARLTFANPMRIEPVVDLEARAKVEEYSIKMNLSGTIDRLAATFSSDPPLPSLDVLGLLSVGEPIATAGAAPLPGAASPNGGPGSVGAEGLLYSQAASLISSRMQGLFGLDKLRIDPIGTQSVVSTARVTVGKRLSRRLYVTYTLDPSTAEQQQVQAEWQVSDQLLLVLSQNGTGSYSVDMRWEKRF